MVVDPVAGVTPPAGTIVTTQAEYDVLGSALRYAQDALDILPPVLGDYVKVRLMAGEHWADVTTQCCLYSAGRMFDLGGKSRIVTDPVLGSIGRSRILFYGDTSIYTASQAGTYTAPRSISCPTGTWSVNELQNKWVYFLTGTLAGSRLPIRNNTATTIELAATISSGSGTFEIRQMDSYLVPTTTGTNTVNTLILSGLPGSNALWYYFIDMNIHKSSKKTTLQSWDYTGLQFVRCAIYGGSTTTYGAILRTTIGMQGCHLIIDTAYPFGFWSGSASLFQCMIRGKTTNRNGFLWVTDNAQLFLQDCVFEPLDGTYTQFMLHNEIGYVNLRSGCLFDGLGTAKGVLAGSDSYGTTIVVVEASPLTINNCVTAVSARLGGKVSNRMTIAGSGNTTIFELLYGGEVEWKRTNITITGTTFAMIDGQSFASSDFAGDGDKIEGPGGSTMLVTA
jgi:hypothetical protein